MKRYEVKYTKLSKKQINKINNTHRKIIKKWINNNLVGCSNPYFSGKPLKGNKKDLWRYRVGNYRVLARIDNDQIIITIVKVGHRQDVYDN